MNLGFDRLYERYRLCGTLTTLTALHIGSGAQHLESASDLPVLRDAQDRPFVPGSSVKGVVRSTIEALLRGNGFRVCNPLDNGCGAHKQGQRAEAQSKIHEHCVVCRVFGSHLLASHVRISDALMAEGSMARIELRDGVAIDRDLRIVFGAQKYDFEVVAPGAQFALEVIIDNPQDWLMGLLLMGFDQLHLGFSALGGFGSRGLGRVEVRWDQLTSCTAKNLLEGLAPDQLKAKDLEGKLDQWRQCLGNTDWAAVTKGGV